MTREKAEKIARGIIDKIECNTADIDDWAEFWGFTREEYEDFLDMAIKVSEPYKGMTNREVIMALFPNPDKIDGYFSFTEEWANAPYTRKER